MRQSLARRRGLVEHERLNALGLDRDRAARGDLADIPPEREVRHAGGRVSWSASVHALARAISERQDCAGLSARPARFVPAVRVEPGNAGGNERQPVALGEELVIPVENRRGLGDEAPVLAGIGVPRPEDVVPEDEPGPIEEAVDDVSLAGRVPPPDGELPVPWHEPAMSVDGRRPGVADVEPLRPRLPHMAQIGVGRPPLGREDDAALPGLDRPREGRRDVRHRVEHHAVGVQGYDDFRELLVGPPVPWIVVDEDADPAAMQHARDLVAELREAPRHVTVEVELRSRIEAEPRVRMPQENRVDAAEPGGPLLDELLGSIASGGDVVERGVVHEEHQLPKRRVAPCGAGVGVRREVELRAGHRRLALGKHGAIPRLPLVPRRIVEADVRVGRRPYPRLGRRHASPHSRATSGNRSRTVAVRRAPSRCPS